MVSCVIRSGLRSIVVKVTSRPSTIHHDELTAHKTVIFKLIEVVIVPRNTFIVAPIFLLYMINLLRFAFTFIKVLFTFEELSPTLCAGPVIFTIQEVLFIEFFRLNERYWFVGLARAASLISSEVKCIILTANRIVQVVVASASVTLRVSNRVIVNTVRDSSCR